MNKISSVIIISLLVTSFISSVPVGMAFAEKQQSFNKPKSIKNDMANVGGKKNFLPKRELKHPRASTQFDYSQAKTKMSLRKNNHDSSYYVKDVYVGTDTQGRVWSLSGEPRRNRIILPPTSYTISRMPIVNGRGQTRSRPSLINSD